MWWFEEQFEKEKQELEIGGPIKAGGELLFWFHDWMRIFQWGRGNCLPSLKPSTLASGFYLNLRTRHWGEGNVQCRISNTQVQSVRKNLNYKPIPLMVSVNG